MLQDQVCFVAMLGACCSHGRDGRAGSCGKAADGDKPSVRANGGATDGEGMAWASCRTSHPPLATPAVMDCYLHSRPCGAVAREAPSTTAMCLWPLINGALIEGLCHRS
jgi:hypothetical protein